MNGGGPNPPPLASCNVPGRLMRCCCSCRIHTDSWALRGYVTRPKPRTALNGLLCGLEGAEYVCPVLDPPSVELSLPYAERTRTPSGNAPGGVFAFLTSRSW